MTKHAVVIGLIYLLIWEGLLGGLLDGVRWLSITRWARAIVEAVADVAGLVERPRHDVRRDRQRGRDRARHLAHRPRLRAFNLTGDE